MTHHIRLVVFCLDGQRYALPLDSVQRVVRAAEVTPLPGAPEIVLGVIDIAGSVFPVLNLRRRLGLSERNIGLTDQFLIARGGSRTVALVMDEARDVIECADAEFIDSDRIVPGGTQVQGVVRLGDGLVLIHDLDKFLMLDEARALDSAMAMAAAVDGA